MSYQKIIIIGRLGRDPEMKYLTGGQQVTSFSVATDRTWTDSNGQKQERTVWFRVSAWGKLGEICNQYLAKGRECLVEGEVQEPRPYQANDGTWKCSLDITAREVKFLGGKGESTGQGEAVASETEEQIPW